MDLNSADAGITRREILRAAVFFAGTALLPGCGRESAETHDAAALTPDQTAMAILSYMADPRFSGAGFTGLITGTEANLELLDLSPNPPMVYFSVPKRGGTSDEQVHNAAAVLQRIAKDGKAEWGKERNGRAELGELIFTPKDPAFLFRISADNFKVELERRISLPFGAQAYEVTVGELVGFISNRSIYGGALHLDTGRKRGGVSVYLANHGALVAKREPSLTRLVNRITDGARTREDRVQRLADFVTKQIDYNFVESLEDFETLKRPNEVLMTRSSDCSGKVVLTASLLEQLGEDYFLLYSHAPGAGHIAIGIKQGAFPALNGEQLTIGDERYLLIETTTEGFQIGRSTLVGGRSMARVTHIQKVGQDRLIPVGR